MSDPTRGSSGSRHRANADRRLGKPAMTPEDSLAVEAYGARGAAMRKTLGTAATALDSSLVQKTKARVKKLFGG